MDPRRANDAIYPDHSLAGLIDDISSSAVFHRDLRNDPAIVSHVSGDHLHFADGRVVYNASGGPAVTALGHPIQGAPSNRRHANMARIGRAIMEQFEHSGFYIPSSDCSVPIIEELCQELLYGTDGMMAKVCIYNSGTEATGATIKLVLQFWRELPQPQPRRVNFIARLQSYHGTSLDALALGHHSGRRQMFEDVYGQNYHHIPPCNEYRGRADGESTESYVARLAQDLRDKIESLGPHTVAAFIAEPVVGAALGCAAAVPGYFAAMKKVCDDYDILMVFDEVMCGMGRTGTLHAWQQEGVVPDIEIVGKALSAGTQPISAVLVGPRVVNAIGNGSALFSHGHTYQAHPVACAAALEVQRIIREQDLVKNIGTMGDLMFELLKIRLRDHPHVGDIRGRGGFRGVEFVLDRKTKASFPRARKIAEDFHQFAMQEPYCIYLYPGIGWGEDGIEGDGFILAPPYHVTENEIKEIVGRTAHAIEDFYELHLNAKL